MNNDNDLQVIKTNNSKNGGTAKATTTKRVVCKFEPLENTIFVDGVPTKYYPFLRPGNKKDLILLQQLEEKKPWDAVHGEIGKSWTTFTGELLLLTDDNDESLFKGVAATTITKRFKDLDKLGSLWDQESRNKKTGADGDDLPCEMKNLIMSVHELYKEYKLVGKESKNAAADAKKIKDREAASAIAWYALGKNKLLLEDDFTGTIDSDVDTVEGSADGKVIDIANSPSAPEVATKKKKTATKGSAAASALDVATSFMKSATARMESTDELRAKREERKKIEAEAKLLGRKNKAMELEQKASEHEFMKENFVDTLVAKLSATNSNPQVTPPGGRSDDN